MIYNLVTILQNIQGTQFDNNGVPMNGMWFEVKTWHTDVADMKDLVVTVGESVALDAEQVSRDKDETAQHKQGTSNDLSECHAAVEGADLSRDRSKLSAESAERSKWDAEAAWMTAASYSNAPRDTFVTEWISNGDGTFRKNQTDKYSAYHYSLILNDDNLNSIVNGVYPTSDPQISGRLWLDDTNTLKVSQG